ncbi:uncharacterized protein TRAVEDRAFT_111792, partial [Trametes versicolor FP-101664 SS1]|uniref:uncharacterized protein n=1 Tax=Trametes versicolor (strain FP-101664) TaxID=717944 RepID=UPI0004621999
LPQLEWEAHICEYVSFLAKQVRQQKPSQPGFQKALGMKIPLLGPRFTPPTFLHLQKRNTTPEITPEQTYLKPLNVVHPFYYPELAQCPRCSSSDIHWNGWSGTGHREVHGIRREETAIGFQLKCKTCEAEMKSSGQRKPVGKDEGYSLLTTNHLFWEGKEHWEIARECSVQPKLFQRAAYLKSSQRGFRTSSSGVLSHLSSST